MSEKITIQKRKIHSRLVLLNYINVEKLTPTYWFVALMGDNIISSHFEP